MRKNGLKWSDSEEKGQNGQDWKKPEAMRMGCY
jgi:hypothetical protein